jgi:bifunctional NMN adenylyltransferase/nudix hydrolase
MPKESVGVVIGRFQIDELHAGHMELLHHAAKINDHVLVLIGTTVVRDSDKNPLDYDTRADMLDHYTGFFNLQYGARVKILSIADTFSNELWSDNVDRIIRDNYDGFDVTLYGGRDSFIPCYSGQFTVEQIETVEGISATERRKEIIDKPIRTSEGRRGAIRAIARQYPKVHPTVDIALLRDMAPMVAFEPNWAVLLGRKPNETKWRLIGGFVDPTDDNYEAAALREAKEETGAEGITSVKCLGSFKINDWRYTREQNKIITSFFRGVYQTGDVKPSDDIAELQWFIITDIKTNRVDINPNHQVLINTLLEEFYGEDN